MDEDHYAGEGNYTMVLMSSVTPIFPYTLIPIDDTTKKACMQSKFT